MFISLKYFGGVWGADPPAVMKLARMPGPAAAAVRGRHCRSWADGRTGTASRV